MIEYVLVVWLVLGNATVAPAIEIGTYHQEARCIASLESIEFEKPGVQFIALCVARDK